MHNLVFNMYTLIRNKTQTAVDKRIAKKTLAFTDLTVSYFSTYIFKSIRKLKINFEIYNDSNFCNLELYKSYTTLKL